MSVNIFLSSFPQIHKHQAGLLALHTPTGKYRTDKTKEDKVILHIPEPIQGTRHMQQTSKVYPKNKTGDKAVT